MGCGIGVVGALHGGRQALRLASMCGGNSRYRTERTGRKPQSNPFGLRESV